MSTIEKDSGREVCVVEQRETDIDLFLRRVDQIRKRIRDDGSMLACESYYRYMYKQGRLGKFRTSILESIEGWSWRKSDRRGRKPGPADKKQFAKYKRMKESGMTNAEMANHLGVSRQAVQQYINRHLPKINYLGGRNEVEEVKGAENEKE